MPSNPTNVSFKKGSQNALDALNTYVEGAFYLTTDTDRLYFAQSSSELVELNQFVHKVTNYNALPNTDDVRVGDFYYLDTENILAIRKANGTWEQINPDHVLNPTASSIAVTTQQNATTNKDESTVRLRVVDTAQNAVDKSFTLIAGSNIHLSSNNTDITISADNDTTNTTYTLGTANNPSAGTITLTDSNTTPGVDTITLTGSGSVSVSSDANGGITINGAPGIQGVSNSFDKNGEFVTTIGLTTGSPKVSTGIIPTIEYGYSQDAKASAVFATDENDNSAPPTAVLNVYTKDEVDSAITARLNTFNAMEFKGTLTSASAATSALVSTANVGDTYLIGINGGSGITSPIIANNGDLVVAEGTDGNVTWTCVQSGNDQIVVANANSVTGTLSFSDSVSRTSLGSIKIEGGNGITVTPSISSETGVNNGLVVNVAHADTSSLDTPVIDSNGVVAFPANAESVVQQTARELYIPAVTGLTVDTYGHITNITTNKYKLQDTHATLENISYSSAADELNTDTVVFTGTIKLDGVTQSKSFTQEFSSDTLHLTPVTVSGDNNSGIAIDLVWGEF